MGKILDWRKEKFNVLIFPAGAENRMDIYDSLRTSSCFNVYGASSKVDHAKYIYPEDHYYIGKLNIAEDSFLENFNCLLSHFSIDFVIPTHDTIAVYLMKRADHINAHIICSPYETAKIAENKKLTAQALRDCSFYPKVYEGMDEVDEYPVFLKPYIGAGSRGVHLVHDREALARILDSEEDLLISEYLPGREYTIGCFTNRKGELLFAGAITRERIQDGRSYHNERGIMNGQFWEIARQLNSVFEFHGSWFFQVKEDKNGALKLLEFSVRQIGEMGVYRQLGVNFAAMSIFDAMGRDVKVLFNDLNLTVDLRFKNNCFLCFEYESVYLDLENTLVVNGRLNVELLNFLYLCFTRGLKVILLTNEKDAYEEILMKYPISSKLFHQVLSINHRGKTSDYITQTKAVYISSNFHKRWQVKESCGIPVFDLDAIECLVERGM